MMPPSTVEAPWPLTTAAILRTVRGDTALASTKIPR
jgi:hypothetical protein